MTTYLSPTLGAKIVKLMIVGMIAFLFLVGYVFFQSYQGRSDLVDSQRSGCERGKLDRLTNAQGLRIQADVQSELKNYGQSARFMSLALGLEERARIKCSQAFPKAGLIP